MDGDMNESVDRWMCKGLMDILIYEWAKGGNETWINQLIDWDINKWMGERREETNSSMDGWMVNKKEGEGWMDR